MNNKAQNILLNLANEKNFTEEITKVVSDYYGVNLYEDTHRRDISNARHVCVYLIKEHTKKISYQYLGDKFGRGSSALILSVNKLIENLEFDKQRQKELEELNNLITLCDGYGNSKSKRGLINDAVILLNDLNPAQIAQFYNIFNNYKNTTDGHQS